MAKKKLIRILAITLLIVSIFMTFGGANVSVVAAEKFTIVALASPGGTISPSGIILVSAGSSKNFTIKPAKGFHIADVQVDGISVGAVGKVPLSNIIGPHRIVAFFRSGRVINAGASEGGTIEPFGLVRVEGGGDQDFVITPNEGYYIADVIVNGKPAGRVNYYKFKKVSAPQSIIAVFNKVYPILASASEGGSISPSGVTMVNRGDNKTYTIAPDAGYHIVDIRVDTTWLGAAVLDNGTYTFTNITAPHDIMVVFSNQYHIISRATKGGTISPLGPSAVNSGGDLKYAILPNNGYYVYDVKVDGVSVGNPEEYEFEDIQTNHIIVAIFAKGVPTTAAE
jgi:hypothetical protein